MRTSTFPGWATRGGRREGSAATFAKGALPGLDGYLVPMIAREQMFQLVANAYPSFHDHLMRGMADDYLSENGDVLYCVALGDLTRHLCSSLTQGTTEEFPATFAMIERLHLEGDPYVREAATIGFLETLRNNTARRGIQRSAIETWLRPESRKWWERLDRFWAGETNPLRERTELGPPTRSLTATSKQKARLNQGVMIWKLASF